MSTPKNVLNALADANEYIVLATQLGNVLVPLVKGAITEIQQIGAGTDTVSYQILIKTDAAELDAVDKLSRDDLEAINAELAKLGKPAIAVSDARKNEPPPGPATDPAPGT